MAYRDRYRFLAELENLGEDRVREGLLRGTWVGRYNVWAKSWLEQKENISDGYAKLDQISIARSAKNAAWFAALVALFALLVSVVSLYISIASSLLPGK